jgi:RimJ/RimL family protein N-acetyltransferase
MKEYRVLQQQIYSLGAFSLVPIRFDDRLDIMKWRNEQIYHLRQNKPLKVEDQENYFNTVISNLFTQEQPNQILFSFLEDDICIGYGGLVHINWIDKNAEISFVMKTEIEKKAFESNWINFLKLIEQVAFCDLIFHKIYTFAFDLRPRLYSALLSSGYREEARLIEHCKFENNYFDVLIHSKININQNLKYRKVTEDDCELFFDWVNDKEVRKNAINKEPVIWENHCEWFINKINDDDTEIYLFFINDKPIGQVRLENKNDFWLIDYSIQNGNRGKGLGTEIIDLVVKNEPSKNYKALVKPSNIGSMKVFKKLGFINEGSLMIAETKLVSFILNSEL